MSRLVSAKCPECDARLDLEFGAPTVRCPFCGTLSRVRGGRSTWFPSFGDAAGAAGDLDDLPVIKLHDPLRWVWAVGAVGGLAVLVIASYLSFQKISGPSDEEDAGEYRFVGALPGEQMTWDGELQAMVLDVNADGIGDPVGWVRFPNPRGGKDYHLAAFDGATGARLWLSERLSIAHRLQYSQAAIVQGVLLHVDSGGLLRAVSLVSGDVTWAAVMGARAHRVCDGGTGLARIELKSNDAMFVALRDGQVVEERAVAPHERCDGIWTDRDGETPWHLAPAPLAGAEPGLHPQIDGVKVRETLYDVATGAALALADVKLQITEQEFLIGFDPRTPGPRRGRHRLPTWRLPVYAETNDYTVRLVFEDDFVAAHGRAVIPYKMGELWRMTAVEMTTGKRLFDRNLPLASHERIGAVTVSPRQVFVATDDRLHVLDITSGDYRMTIGR